VRHVAFNSAGEDARDRDRRRSERRNTTTRAHPDGHSQPWRRDDCWRLAGKRGHSRRSSSRSGSPSCGGLGRLGRMDPRHRTDRPEVLRPDRSLRRSSDHRPASPSLTIAGVRCCRDAPAFTRSLNERHEGAVSGTRRRIPIRGSAVVALPARTDQVTPRLVWAGTAWRPRRTGTHGDRRARARCAPEDRRAGSARVRRGPAAPGTRTRR